MITLDWQIINYLPFMEARELYWNKFTDWYVYGDYLRIFYGTIGKNYILAGEVDYG